MAERGVSYLGHGARGTLLRPSRGDLVPQQLVQLHAYVGVVFLFQILNSLSLALMFVEELLLLKVPKSKELVNEHGGFYSLIVILVTHYH